MSSPFTPSSSHGVTDVTAADIDSEAAADGTVLTADGAGGSAFEAAALGVEPWLVDIDPYVTALANTNWSTLVNTAALNAYIMQSTGAQNASVEWDVGLSAGTWTLALIVLTFDGSGILTVSLDGVSVGTSDHYSVALEPAVRKDVAGIVVAASGVKRLKFTMATKNASSSAYYGSLSAVQLLRTA